MKWLELRARTDPEGAEAASEMLNRFAYGGTILEVEAAKPGQVTVRAYLPAEQATSELQRTIQEAWWHLRQLHPLGLLRRRTVDESEWASAWKEHFPVHRVGQRLVIKPSWRPYEGGPGQIVIELDPGAAFGTGLHPTTALCLQELEERVHPGLHVLDLGTGSGILAIAAAKLGADQVLALDIDPVAVQVAQENVGLNGVADLVTVRLGTLSPDSSSSGGRFELIVANLTADGVIGLAPALSEHLLPGGTLVASGVIRGRSPEVRRALQAAGLSRLAGRWKAGWLALAASRR